MNRETWEKLSFFEQISNMDGDVERLIRAHNRYLEGGSESDKGFFYIDNINKLIKMTFMDPKNYGKGYRIIELIDEVEELKHYLEGERSEEYIRNYWSEYTRAISSRKAG